MKLASDRLRTLRVVDVMCRKVVELKPDQSVEEVAEQFDESGLSSAPVVDGQHKCVGMFSAADFVQVFRSEPSSSPSVADFMSASVVSVEPQQSLLEAATVMSRAHIHHLPVIQDGIVVGLVSTMDIVAAMLNIVDEVEVLGTDR